MIVMRGAKRTGSIYLALSVSVQKTIKLIHASRKTGQRAYAYGQDLLDVVGDDQCVVR